MAEKMKWLGMRDDTKYVCLREGERKCMCETKYVCVCVCVNKNKR